MSLTLITHTEKVQFLKNFLNNQVEGMTNARPLMLRGSGANGKSFVLQEVAETSPVNILVIHPGDGHRFLPSAKPSEECVILMMSNGDVNDATLAYHLNAYIVDFKKDPAFT